MAGWKYRFCKEYKEACKLLDKHDWLWHETLLVFGDYWEDFRVNAYGVIEEEIENFREYSEKVYKLPVDDIKDKVLSAVYRMGRRIERKALALSLRVFDEEERERYRTLAGHVRWLKKKIGEIYREKREDVEREKLDRYAKELKETLTEYLPLLKRRLEVFLEIGKKLIDDIDVKGIVNEMVTTLQLLEERKRYKLIKREDDGSDELPGSYTNLESFVEKLVDIGFKHALVEDVKFTVEYEGIVKGAALGLKHAKLNLKELLELYVESPVPLNGNSIWGEAYSYSLPVDVRDRILLLEDLAPEIANHKFAIVKTPFQYEYLGKKKRKDGREYHVFKRVFKERWGSVTIYAKVQLNRVAVLGLYTRYLAEGILNAAETIKFKPLNVGVGFVYKDILQKILDKLAGKSIDEQEEIITRELVELYKYVVGAEPLELRYMFKVKVLELKVVFHGTYPKVPGLLIKYMKKHYRKRIKDEQLLRKYNLLLNELANRNAIAVEVIVNGTKLESPFYPLVKDLLRYYSRLAGKKLTPTIQNRFWWILPLYRPEKEVRFGHQALMLMKRSEAEEFVRKVKAMRKAMKRIGKTVFVKREESNEYNGVNYYLFKSRNGAPFNHFVASSEPLTVIKVDLQDEYVYVIDSVDKTKNVMLVFTSLHHPLHRDIDILKKNGEVLVIRHLNPDKYNDETEMLKVLSKPLTRYLFVPVVVNVNPQG